MNLKKTAWLGMLLFSLGLMGLGQKWLLLEGDVIFGALATLVGILFCWAVGTRKSRELQGYKAIMLAGATSIYFWGAIRCSLSCAPQNLVLALFILAGVTLVFAVRPALGGDALNSAPDSTENIRWRTVALCVIISMVAAIMTATIYFSKKYLAVYDSSIINTFFVFRKVGEVNNVHAWPFQTWNRLAIPAIYLTGLLFYHRLVLTRQPRAEWKPIIGLYLLANIGALSIAYLSSEGLGVLYSQMYSFNYDYNYQAWQFKTFTELWKMVGEFVVNPAYRYLYHTGAHPPFALVLNWFVIQITCGNRTLMAILLGLLAWSAIFPIYWMGRELYNREYGYYMAGLYAALPNSLILTYVALDALIAAMIAWCLALLVVGVKRSSNIFMLLAGGAVAVTAGICYVTPVFLPSLVILAVAGIFYQQPTPAEGRLKSGIKKMGWYLLGLLVPYLAILVGTHGKFDYLTMVHYAVYDLHAGIISQRPWWIWFWLSPLEYFIYAGAALTALYLVRWREILRGYWKEDLLPWVGLITMLIPCLSANTRNETERIYMFFNVFVVPTAALALWKKPVLLRLWATGKKAESVPEWGGGSRGLFLLVVALSYIMAVIIEIIAIDYC